MRRSRRSPRRSAMPRRAPSPAPFATGRGARPPNGAPAGSAVEGGDVHREGAGAKGGDIAQILGARENVDVGAEAAQQPADDCHRARFPIEHLLGNARGDAPHRVAVPVALVVRGVAARSEEHTSELQSLMRISYAVFCLKKKTHTTNTVQHPT